MTIAGWAKGKTQDATLSLVQSQLREQLKMRFLPVDFKRKCHSLGIGVFILAVLAGCATKPDANSSGSIQNSAKAYSPGTISIIIGIG